MSRRPTPSLAFLRFLRRTLHWTHALAGIFLIATGLVIEFPDLRARVVGGYGRQIADLHTWVGFALIALPVALVAWAARPLFADLRRRLGPPGGLTWRKFHIALSLALTVLLSVSGVLLWSGLDVPLWLYDAALYVHIAATWVLIPALPVHVFMAWPKIVSSFRDLGKEPDLGFPLEDEDLDPGR